MAEESVYVPITPEIVRPDEVRSRSSEKKPVASKSRATTRPDPRRASTGALSNGGRKFSSAKLSPLNSGESSVPHYLRASTGSCHDFCKFGWKHETEVKPWQAKARKVVKRTLNKQNDSEAGDLSEMKITKTVNSKPLLVSKTNSPNRSAVFKNKISSPCNESIIPSRPVSAKVKDIPVKEKTKNVTEKQNTLVSSGRRESEIKTDKTKGTPKEDLRKVVSSPVAYLAAKPSFSRHLSLEVNANRSKKLVSPLKGQNKIAKAEHKHSTNDIVKEKTLHVIEVEAKKTVPEVREKNQEGIKEVENELLENLRVTDDNFSVLKVASEKRVPESKHNEGTFDPPSSESSSYPSTSSPVISSSLSDGEEKAEDGFEYNTREKKVPNSKQTGSTIDIHPSESFSFPNISSPVKCPALSYGEEEAQDKLEYTNNEKTVPELRVKNQDEIKEVEKEHVENEKVTDETLSILKVHSEKILPELKQNEITFDPPSSESSSSSSISSPVISSMLSDGEEKAEDELEYNTREKKVADAKQTGSTIDIPLSESFSSPNISSAVKCPALFFGEEEAQEELEYTNSEKTVPELRVKNQDKIKDVEKEHVENEKVTDETLSILKVHSEKILPELKQNEITFDPPSSESSSSSSISSPVISSMLSDGEEKAEDELEYNTREKKVPDAKQTGSTIDIPLSESFSSPNISSPVKCPALFFGEEEAQDELEYTNSKKTVPELRVKNQDEIKEVEKEHVENEKVTDETLSVHSEKILPELKQNEITFDPPSSESSSSSSISSPVIFSTLSDGEEKAEDELEYNTREKKVPDAKQTGSAIDILPSESFSSPNIASPVKCPALSYGEEEAQDELEYTNSEKTVPELRVKNQGEIKEVEQEHVENEKVTDEALSILKVHSEKILPESKQNEITFDPPSSESSSSSSMSSPVKSPTFSDGEVKVEDELEYNTTEKKVPEAKKNEATIDIPPSESFSSLNISSPVKSPALYYADEAAQDELEIEYTIGEKKVPESEQNDSTYVSLPSESFPSPNTSSPVESPALYSGGEEAQDELEYLDNEAEGSDDSISESSETLKSDDEETFVGNQGSEIGKAKGVSVENTTTKLKFRRGKVVEIESNDSGPRRLRFRRPRVLGENQDNGLTNRRRRFTKGGVVDDIDGTNADSEKVVLRHQEVEGKKDAQGLFNNVIEETASKLVETRKSKVKALVGAFETVISLQETKPSTQAGP